MADIEFARVWAMPSAHTFSIRPIHDLLKQEVPSKKGQVIIDPYSGGEREFATVTNDLNPSLDADYHLDAIDFLNKFSNNSVDCVIFDPPYSVRQVSEHYHKFGYTVTRKTTDASWRTKQMEAIKRIVKVGGKVISFGWNTSGVGKTRGFQIYRILIVSHGAPHNDTLVTCEKKVKQWQTLL